MGTFPSRHGSHSVTLGDVDRWALEALTGFECHRGRWLHRRLFDAIYEVETAEGLILVVCRIDGHYLLSAHRIKRS